MRAFNQATPDYPELPDPATVKLRVDLIAEELQELKDAIAMEDLVGVADALTDILYVTYGAGVAFGLDLDDCFEEVHSSNMSKLDEEGNPIYRADGKVLKGPFYRPPDLKSKIYK
jgi:predicted HAD superfamily Cof-like phosphohydrolase